MILVRTLDLSALLYFNSANLFSLVLTHFLILQLVEFVRRSCLRYSFSNTESFRLTFYLQYSFPLFTHLYLLCLGSQLVHTQLVHIPINSFSCLYRIVKRENELIDFKYLFYGPRIFNWWHNPFTFIMQWFCVAQCIVFGNKVINKVM